MEDIYHISLVDETSRKHSDSAVAIVEVEWRDSDNSSRPSH